MTESPGSVLMPVSEPNSLCCVQTLITAALDTLQDITRAQWSVSGSVPTRQLCDAMT